MMTEDTIVQHPEAAVDYGHALISSRRVEGTPVYNKAGEKLGTVHSVMIEKRSGKVAYAVMSFGGFLGVGGRVHPIPWERLTYDVDRDGYVIDVTREQLEKAPSMHLDDTDRPVDESYEEASSYYGTMRWWGL
ncbi:MAG: PRC-barrel domain-containing protein [Pseudomonadota bacterium]|nr:PRC-barrel domain-containing protein [Pseudomonadota bacterium]